MSGCIDPSTIRDRGQPRRAHRLSGPIWNRPSRETRRTHESHRGGGGHPTVAVAPLGYRERDARLRNRDQTRMHAAAAGDALPAYRHNVRRYRAFYFFYDLQWWMPIWVAFLIDDQDFSFTKITRIGVPFWIIVAFGQVPAGALSDRWGRVWSLRAGAVLYAASMLSFGLAEPFAPIMLSWILWAFAFAIVTGADSAFLHDSLKADGRESQFEKIAGRTFAVRSVAVVVATLLGAPSPAPRTSASPSFSAPPRPSPHSPSP